MVAHEPVLLTCPSTPRECGWRSRAANVRCGDRRADIAARSLEAREGRAFSCAMHAHHRLEEEAIRQLRASQSGRGVHEPVDLLRHLKGCLLAVTIGSRWRAACVQECSIVPLGHIGLRQLSVLVDLLLNPLLLHATEEGFDDGVDAPMCQECLVRLVTQPT
jgi:hypothetical protein